MAYSKPNIPNEQLTLDDIPTAQDHWGTIGNFALSFDGYRHWGGTTEVAATVADQDEHHTMSELRTYLFVLQRRCRYHATIPTNEEYQRVFATLDKLREKIHQRDFR